MKRKKLDSLRRTSNARRAKQIPERQMFAQQDARDAIESKLASRVVGVETDDMSEEDARDIAFNNHPDLKALEELGTLPDKIRDEKGDVWSPRMHIAMHTIIERQLACDEPAGIVELAIRLERELILCAHEIKHAIAAALVEQILAMQHGQEVFDAEQYLADIESAYQQYCESR